MQNLRSWQIVSCAITMCDLAWKSSILAQISSRFSHGPPGSEVQFQFLTLKLNNRLNLKIKVTGDISLRWQRLFDETGLPREKRRRLALFVVITSAKVVVGCLQRAVARLPI